MFPLLSIKNLLVTFTQDGHSNTAANIASLDIEKGKTLALVGESGSGKSVTALSILRLLPRNANISGSILFTSGEEKQMDLWRLSQKQMRKIRGNKIAMIFQEPMTSLNPVLTCGWQVMETLIAHKQLSKKAARLKTIELFTDYA
jgi:peptide/nickel transport system ATP-binding protein